MRAAANVGGFELDVAFASTSQAVAILGPSGAGKSLTLRTIAGLLRPAFGLVSIEGKVLLNTSEGLDVAPERRGLGYVAQKDGLFDHLDVEANITFALRDLPVAERFHRVTELLAATGLTSVRHQRPVTFQPGSSASRREVPGARSSGALLMSPSSPRRADPRQLRKLVGRS